MPATVYLGRVKWLGRIAAVLLVMAGIALLSPQSGESSGQTPGLSPVFASDRRMTVHLDSSDFSKTLALYEELTGRSLYPSRESMMQRLDRATRFQLSRHGLVSPVIRIDSGASLHGDGLWRASEVKERVEADLLAAGLVPVSYGRTQFILRRRSPAPLPQGSAH
jgi:hypothetical protein